MTPYYEQDGVTIYRDRCETVLQGMSDDSVDLIVTDPPYFRVKGDWWDRQWNSREGFLSWMGGLCDEWRRVLTPNGSVFVFASPDMAWHVEGVVRERFNVLNTIRWVKDAGWHNKTEKDALRSFLSPWESVIFAEQFGDEYEDAAQALHKRVFAPIGRYIQEERERAGLTRSEVEVGLGYVSRSDPTRGTALCYRWEEGSSLPTKETYDRLRAFLNHHGRSDDVLQRSYAELQQQSEDLRKDYEDLRKDYEDLRRPFALTDRSEWSDVWNFAAVQARYGKHPCEKPLALAEHIVRSASKPGAVVLDCFAGTGAFVVAARNLGRQAIGVEIQERHAASIVARLSQGLLSLEDVA